MTKVQTVWGGYISCMSFILFLQSVSIQSKLSDIRSITNKTYHTQTDKICTIYDTTQRIENRVKELK